jgi:hypothetical protein
MSFRPKREILQERFLVAPLLEMTKGHFTPDKQEDLWLTIELSTPTGM